MRLFFLALLASATTLLAQIPPAPSMLRAVTNGPSSVSLTWRDNSNNESNMIVAFKLSTTNIYTAFPGGTRPANTTNFTAANATALGYYLVPGKTYQFIVVAYISDQLLSQSSAVTVVLPELNPPINLTATNITANSLNLSWKDNSSNEVNYLVGLRVGTNGGYSLASGGFLPANTTNFTVTGLSPGTTYQFLVESYRDDYTVADSTNLTVKTLNTFLGRSWLAAEVGQFANYTLLASTNSGAPTNYALLGTIPPGMVYSSASRQLSGVPTQAGVFQLQRVAQYTGGVAITNPLTVRVIHPPGPPVVTATLTNQTFARGGSAVSVPLDNFFTDRDTERAVRFTTTKGQFDVALYATATPQTVSNFLGYVDRGDYTDTIVHRSARLSFAENFVIQGGGYRPAPPNFTAVPTVASPTNEPGIRHVRGTLAMAKVGGNPHSATSQWFVNLRDNSDQLDDQNEGFAAFARVLGDGMAVVDAIAALPVGDYTVNVDGQSTPFQDWPLDDESSLPEMDQSKLVLVQSVTRIPPLTYQVTGNSSPGVVAAAIVNGTNLVLTPLSQLGGTTTITVTATDRDGNNVSQQFTATITSPYTTWQNQYALTGANALATADPDGDGVTNAVEFALGGLPLASDAPAVRPTRSVVTVGPDRHLALTFKLRKDLSGMLVRLRAASTVNSGYTEIWNSAGVGAGLVVQQTEADANYWLMTVRDSVPLPAAPVQRFLHLQVNAPQ
jgi:cyclophilin family peptidyl-prolyl cis-trans isomerase